MSILDGIPKKPSVLKRATDVQNEVSKVGFDWKDPRDILNKVKEELEELTYALESQNSKKINEELGDLFFSLVNLSRYFKIDSEEILKEAVEKFINRFKLIEAELERKGRNIKKCSLKEMDKIWEKLKSS